MKRRLFLGAAGAAPAVQLVRAASADKFTPVRLHAHFNTTAREFGPRTLARNPPDVRDNLLRPPGGSMQLRGLPFELGPQGVDRKAWIVLRGDASVNIAVGRTARFLCLAQFCDWEKAETDPEDVDAIESIGAVLAEAILIYDDGSRRSFPVRRRFEVNPPAAVWGRECFNAMQSNTWQAAGLDDPLAKATDWGQQQQSVLYKAINRTALWLWALENPSPEKPVKTLRIEARGADPLCVCGLTLYHGRENPLRLEKRALYRITLPEGGGPERWKVETDLGIVVRVFAGIEFVPDEWLKDIAGIGERRREPSNDLYVEVTASREATLTLIDTKTGARHSFELDKPAPRIELLEPHKTWIHGRIVDASGKPVAARLAFRSRQGRYIPPYGHRTELNSAWFQDYGADVQVGRAPFAYVDGTFQMELPTGDVYVEVSKGFEYQAARKHVRIEAGQRELELRLDRMADWRKDGWVTADTHVHFLSPSTALLEAQAEGLNLVNLLAAQWGDLYTNVGDLPYGPLVSADRETLVSLGTENRQHMLGHLGLLGGHGEPVFPMSADGGGEGFPGDPLWTSMSDWADACRKREGLVVAVHFPIPNAEMAAEIVRGKVDAVELYPPFQSLGYNDWYRYLNCGYRVAAAGGTDKMAGTTPVGGNRTYAYLGDQEFTFANWAAAVREGRTFTTSGPLLDFRVDGKTPGDEIRLRSGGGSIEVRLNATCYVPFHRLEVVVNGRVVASRDDAGGTRQMQLAETVKVQGPGWIAARCSSRVPAARFAVAAHTSPVYLIVPGEEAFSGPAAAYFLKLIEGTQIYVDNLATRPDRERLERIRAVLRDAHDRLHARMVRHRHV